MAGENKSSRLATLGWIGVIGIASLTLVGARAVEDRVVQRRRRDVSGLGLTTSEHAHALSRLAQEHDNAKRARQRQRQRVSDKVKCRFLLTHLQDATLRLGKMAGHARGVVGAGGGPEDLNPNQVTIIDDVQRDVEGLRRTIKDACLRQRPR